eukprot:Phypoly_transcript_17808.p1 GENE.Phypoly_transcript_17808~~Phypoly_transcript_17808.p1  ORF type:complete len:172 (-),score=33.05 Phypoly_transcript_17808:61-576(-)
MFKCPLFALACLFLSVAYSDVTVIVGFNNTLTYKPENVTINVGDRVNWVWQGNYHNVISGSQCSDVGVPPLQSGNPVNPPYNFSYTFTAPGVYPYFCTPHCTKGMVGSVNVIGNATSTTGSATTASATTGTATTASATASSTTNTTHHTSATSVLVPSIFGALLAVAGIMF